MVSHAREQIGVNLSQKPEAAAQHQRRRAAPYGDEDKQGDGEQRQLEIEDQNAGQIQW